MIALLLEAQSLHPGLQGFTKISMPSKNKLIFIHVIFCFFVMIASLKFLTSVITRKRIVFFMLKRLIAKTYVD
jgi:hypothetical protein